VLSNAAKRWDLTMNIAVNSRTDLSMLRLVPTSIVPDAAASTRIEITEDGLPCLNNRTQSRVELDAADADRSIPNDAGNIPYEGIVEEVDLLLRQARLRELVVQARMMEAIRLCSKEVTHDFNNLLQVAVSGLDLLQFRVEQGRISEISEVIERTHVALELLGKLAGRIPQMWSAAAVEVEGIPISEYCLEDRQDHD
jgi:C4-dicarboxylate-specific signal transduction histidine kinase